MKTLLLSLVLLVGVTSVCLADGRMGYSYSSRPNIWGGQNYYRSGCYQGYSRQNFYRGYNYYTPYGNYYSRPNVFGGYYYYGR